MTRLETPLPVQEHAVSAPSEASALRASFALAALLAALLDLLVTWQVQRNADAVNYHMLALCAVFCILDAHRPFPRVFPTVPTVLCGSLCFASALIKARGMVSTDSYRHLFAFFLAAGLAVTAFGFRETARLWKIWVILLLLSAIDLRFQEFGAARLHLNQFGAAISANLLLLTGYASYAQGDVVAVPGGSVKVYAACSAATPILYLLKLSMLALLVFPSRWWQKLAVVAVAIVTALFFNAVRIGVMAVLNAAGDHARFDYWHEGAGSNVFSVLYMAAFCALCAGCLRLGSGPPATAADEAANPALPSL